MVQLLTGKYRHYKGKFYRVLGIARHSETLEEYVVYQALYDSPQFGNKALWIRPKKMFFEKIEMGTSKIPRFQKIK